MRARASKERAPHMCAIYIRGAQDGFARRQAHDLKPNITTEPKHSEVAFRGRLSLSPSLLRVYVRARASGAPSSPRSCARLADNILGAASI